MVAANMKLLLGLLLMAMGPVWSQPYFGVYRWATSPDFVDAYAKWVGHDVIWAEDFEATESWDNIANPTWQFKPWSAWVAAQPGRRLILSVPLLPGPWDGSGATLGTIDVHVPVSLEQGAAGAYNDRFAALAAGLVKWGLGNSMLRLGWEFNGGWYTWRAQGKAAAYAAYWRQIVTAMRAVAGAGDLRFVWNPDLGYQSFPAEQAWPGDDYVNYVGIDVYDDSYAANTYPWPVGTSDADIENRRELVWNSVIYNGDHGLVFWQRFATQHQKPLAIPEWGVSQRTDTHGGLDNPFFIQKMFGFLYAPCPMSASKAPCSNVYFHSYFDVNASDGAHQLSPGASCPNPACGPNVTAFPNSAGLFLELFKPQRSRDRKRP